MQIFKNQFGNFINFNIGFIIILACLIACLIAASRSLPLLSFTGNHIADFGFAVACANLFFLAIIKAKFIFIKRANRHFDDTFAVRKNDGFIRDNRTQILLNCLFDAFFMTLLIYLTFALQRPIIALNGHIFFLKWCPHIPKQNARALQKTAYQAT